MKNKFNLIKGLWDDSHEKQTPQRFRRYAVMLMMLLTFGVGQMWATWYVRGIGTGLNSWGDASDAAMTQSSANSNIYYFKTSGQCTFKIVDNPTDWNCNVKNASNHKADGYIISLSDVGDNNHNFQGGGSGENWYICYNSSTDKVFGVFSMNIAGDEWGGLSSWSTSGCEMAYDGASTFSKTISSVSAAAHKLKITRCNTNNNWGDARYWTNSSSTTTCTNGTCGDDNTNDHNIRFTPYAAGSVTITYNWSNGNISIACTAPTVTFDKEGGDGGADSQSTPYGTATSSITTPSKTGYNFGGYYDGDDGTGNQVINASGVWQKNKTNFTNNDATCKWVVTSNRTLYAKWTEKTYSLTFSNDGHGSVEVGGAAVASGSTASVNHFTTKTLVATPNTYYQFDNWALSGSNTSAVTIGSSTSASTTIKATNTGATVTANFAKKTYSITLNDYGDYQGDGSATVQYGDAALTVVSHARRTDWNLVGYWNSAGNQVTDSEGALLTSVSGYTDGSGHWIYDGNVTLYAHWSQTYSLTVAAGSNISSVSGSNADVTLNSKYAISATPNSGYSFSGWTASPAENGTFDNASSASTNVIVKNGSVTVTANARERMSSLTTSNYYDAGNPSYAIPTKSASSIGISTTATLTATTPSTGYTFAGWTLSDNIVVTGGDKDNDLSITVRTNGNGAEATAQANYNEVLTSTYYLVGNNLAVFPGDKTWTASDSKNMLRKASGSSTGDVGSITIDVKSIPANNSDYQFKIHESTGNKWWGWSNEYYYKMDATKTTSLYDNQHHLYFIPNALGDYTFSVNWSNASEPSLTVTFPATTYTVNFGQGAGTARSTSATYSSTSFSSGTKVQNGKSITLTAPSASSGYTWDGWYNASSGGTRVSTSNPLTTIVSSTNYNFYARYTENSYSTNVAVSPVGYGSISSPTPATGKISVSHHTGTEVTASANTNYVFDHWAVADGGLTVSSTTTNPATFNATAANGTITAHFDHQWCLKGDRWSNWTESKGMPYDDGIVETTLTLTKGQKYKFKVHDRKTNTWYGNTKDAGEHAMGRGDAAYGTATNGGNDDNLTITPDVTGTYTFSFNTSTKALTVTFPTAYTVTYGAGTINGSNSAISVSPSFTSGDYVLPETDITFSKGTTKNGYTWKGWYSNVGGTGDAWSTTDASLSLTDTRDGNISVYACYNFITYSITYNLNGGSNPVSPAPASSFNVETPTITLPTPTRTGYTFNGWYANSDLSTGGVKTQIAKGTHEDQEFWAKWTAKTYTITLKSNGGSGDDQELTATYDAKAPNSDGAGNYRFDAITIPTRTGYTFGGWWTSSDGGTTLVTQIITEYKYYEWNTSYVNNKGIWKHDGNVTVYAKWTPNEYAVTLSTTGETGYGSNAPANQTATYGAAMPTITPPVGAPGYKFMGYFTSAGGAGTKYYNADGTSAKNWDIAEATTLHAHFRKTEISSLEHPAAVATGETVYVVVNPVLNQEGAQPNMKICWSLLYDNDNPVESGWSVESYTEEGTKQNQVRFTLTGMSSGYYKIQAVLYANSSVMATCDDGTELSTIKSDLRIAGNSTVTIQYEDASGNTLRENATVEVARGDSIGVNAPSIVGYTFSEWVLGDVLSSACRDASTCALNKDSINIKAEYDGVLIAQYNRKNTIYFKNTLNWPAVYVNLLNEGYWGANGSGNKDQANRNLAMTRLGESDIWYYEYDGKTATAYVSFTSVEQNGTGTGAGNFWGADTEVENKKVKVVYPTRPNYDANERTAYGFNVNTPMFVPLAGQTAKEMNKYSNGRAYYYNQGYWAKYEPVSKETGYTLKIFNKKNNAAEPDAGNAPVLVKSVPFVFNGDMTFPVSVTVDLEAGKCYGFKLYRDKGNEGDALSWYGNGGNMSNKHSGDFDKGEAVWEFKSTQASNCGLQTTSAGDYVFTLAYGKEAFKDSIQYLIGVHYPEAAGDYRLVYSDNNRTGILSTTIPFESEADTLSFFVDKTASPKLALQKCAIEYKDETSTVTWTDTIADLFSGGLPSAITKSGVYYFCINKDPETGKKVFGDTKLYEGNFYIRTDGATPSKWDNFRQNNHLMAYSDYADLHENFTHSYTQWYDITNRKNLKFTVANDYSVSISDTLVREALEGQWTNIDDYIDEKGDLSREANVRFMYNSKTNAISRAYIDGAYEAGGNFLKILARTQDSIYAAAEGGDPLTEITFTDNGNWLYEQTVFAQPGARYKLRSLFGETGGGKEIITQYFKGGAGSTAADSATMIGGSGSSRMQIRLLYDFKTNRVVTAYQPAGTIDENLAIHADIMFMREHQGDIEQITFAEGKSISEIENIYCGLRFNKWTLNNKSKETGHATLSPLLSRYERDIFYVSFPYDVRLSDVIGFGTYGQHWIIEYYDGAARAKNGFWIDSDSYWKFVTPSMKDTFTLKAGTGYIVALDLDELYYISKEVHASIWNNTDISDLELLFPGNVSSISNVDVTYNMPSHECKINRGTTAGNRTKKDSHWNVLGVPTFKNITGDASGEPDEGVGRGEIVFANKAWVKDSLKLKFIYDGNLADNSLTPKAVKDFEFKAMHAYVVQYCGNVTFTTSATPAPASVAARTYAEKPIDVDYRLELNKDGVVEDQTFVSLSNDENASADFRFGEDMSKEFNSNRANIYTFIGTEWVAGNTLPMTNQTTIVPVGVKIAADGEYTFSIPEGTYGVGITLIDNETGIRTSLSALDYTINLPAGTYNERFVLEISPIRPISTDLENTEYRTQNTDVHKVLIDNILYIVKDGVMYDARGSRVQ